MSYHGRMPKLPAPAPKGKFCPYCLVNYGAKDCPILDLAAKFCPRCGKTLPKDNSSNIPRAPLPFIPRRGMRFCPHCLIQHGLRCRPIPVALKVCPKCGKPMPKGKQLPRWKLEALQRQAREIKNLLPPIHPPSPPSPEPPPDDDEFGPHLLNM
jgi:Zn-finger nucleic acid-binding protein